MMYKPDHWVVVKITPVDTTKAPPHYRVFATWNGSYLTGSSWKLNSGIVRAQLNEDFYEFDGSSGSVYRCHKSTYGKSGYGFTTLQQLIENSKEYVSIEELDINTNFLELDYS